MSSPSLNGAGPGAAGPEDSLEAAHLLPALGFFSGLSPAVLNDIARNCEQILLPAGHLVFRQGDPSDSLYIVSTGRLDVSVESEDHELVSIYEAGRGQIVGEMGLITGDPRSASVRSLRDSLLFRLSKEHFDNLIELHPVLMRRIACNLSERLKQSNSRTSLSRQNVKSFAVFPAGGVAPTAHFVEGLTRALNEIAPARRITKAVVEEAIASQDMSDHRVVHWLNEQESKFGFLIYETDPRLSPWTLRCIRQADHLLSVARSEESKDLNEIELSLLQTDRKAAISGLRPCHPRVDLILLHDDPAVNPSQTPEWLKGRSVDRHHHVWSSSFDAFRRLARVLTGNAVGLVLGGGGARGFAHIGAIQAIEEAGLTIETIGGTSQGALIAAQYALGQTPSEIAADNRAFFCGSRFYKGDITLPIYSFLRGEASNKGLHEKFGETYISDLRIPFFCVSSDLSRAKLVVHRHDLVWKAVRCSMGLPGLMPPIIDQGNLIVDGGILNNLPADVMRQHCLGSVIAVDVSSPVDLIAECEDRNSLGFLDFLRQKMFWRKEKRAIPNMIEILMRTAVLSSIYHREAIIAQSDLYISPPMDEYPMLGWRNIDALIEIGYKFTRSKLEGWNTKIEEPAPVLYAS